jgi:hypothetical protein
MIIESYSFIPLDLCFSVRMIDDFIRKFQLFDGIRMFDFLPSVACFLTVGRLEHVTASQAQGGRSPVREPM